MVRISQKKFCENQTRFVPSKLTERRRPWSRRWRITSADERASSTKPRPSISSGLTDSIKHRLEEAPHFTSFGKNFWISLSLSFPHKHSHTQTELSNTMASHFGLYFVMKLPNLKLKTRSQITTFRLSTLDITLKDNLFNKIVNSQLLLPSNMCIRSLCDSKINRTNPLF